MNARVVSVTLLPARLTAPATALFSSDVVSFAALAPATAKAPTKPPFAASMTRSPSAVNDPPGRYVVSSAAFPRYASVVRERRFQPTDAPIPTFSPRVSEPATATIVVASLAVMPASPATSTVARPPTLAVVVLSTQFTTKTPVKPKLFADPPDTPTPTARTPFVAVTSRLSPNRRTPSSIRAATSLV